LTTPPLGNIPVSPAIPLTDEVRAAYRDIYDKLEAAIEGTEDAAVLQALNPWVAEVDDILTKDDMYRLQANSAVFDALLQQINYTNIGLKKLQGQVASIASHFAMAGDIIAAIDKVLTLVPGA
jgi:hypothetical protein